MFSKLSRALYKGGRLTQDARAVTKTAKQGSLKPILKRLLNKWIGRNIVSKLFIK